MTINIRSALRFGWPQCFALAHLIYLAIGFWSLRYGGEYNIFRLGFVFTLPLVEFSSLLFQIPAVNAGLPGYLGFSLFLVVGTLQWCLIGWCGGYLFRWARNEL